MDKNAFHKISYGLYVVSSSNDGKFSGCVSNTFIQVTSDPSQVAITLNKNNFTTSLIENSAVYNVVIMQDNVSDDTIKHFGFQSGRDVDKFADIEFDVDSLNLKYPTTNMAAMFSVKVNQIVTLSTHIMFIGEVVDCKVLSNEKVLTYENYHARKSQKPKSGWRCDVCGFVYDGEELPEDYICPVCKQPASVFKKI